MKKTLALLMMVFVLTGCGRWYSDYGLKKEQLTQPIAVPSLIRALSDEDEGTRHAALVYLWRNTALATSQIDNYGLVVEPIKKVAVADSSTDNRRSALRILDRVMNPEERKIFLATQAKENSEGDTRDFASRLIEKISSRVSQPPPSIIIFETEKVDFNIEPKFRFFNGFRTLTMRSHELLPIEVTITNNSLNDVTVNGQDVSLKNAQGWIINQIQLQPALDSMRIKPSPSNFVFPWTIGKTTKANVKVHKYCKEKHLEQVTIPPGATYSGVLFFRVTRDISNVNGWTVSINVMAGETGKAYGTVYIFG